MSSKIIAIALILIGLTACNNRNKPNRPNLTLSSYNYELGILKNDSIYKGSSIIINSGSGELVINTVSAGCGCTSAKVNKNRLAPGDTTLLKFTYNTYGKRGNQTEIIVITANTDSLVHLLKVFASVE